MEQLEIAEEVLLSPAPVATAQIAPPAAAGADAPQLYRVVHTSGEQLVASLREASLLLAKLPGARVYRTVPLATH